MNSTKALRQPKSLGVLPPLHLPLLRSAATACLAASAVSGHGFLDPFGQKKFGRDVACVCQVDALAKVACSMVSS